MSSSFFFSQKTSTLLPEKGDPHSFILGIDEAGRGAVLGPMVVAGFYLKRKNFHLLKDLPIADSKSYGSSPSAQKHRKQLSKKLLQIGQGVVVKVPSCAVDHWIQRGGGLNALEVECARYIIKEGPPVVWAMADGKRIFDPLSKTFPWFHSENKADATHRIVSAASIIAKDERDFSMNAISKSYEPLVGTFGGGGYANKKTAAFLHAYHSKFHRLPSEVRLSWKWEIIEELLGKAPPPQTNLF